MLEFIAGSVIIALMKVRVLRRRTLFSLTLGLGFLDADAVSAQTLPAIYAGPINRQQRVELARAWLRAFDALDAAMPTLSPREEEWVQQEYDEELRRNGRRFTQRLFNAIDSREFNIREVRRWTVNVRRALNGAIIANEPQAEMASWAYLVQQFTDSQSTNQLVRLHILNVIPAHIMPFMPSGARVDREIYLSNVLIQANAVARNILTPYLTGLIR